MSSDTTVYTTYPEASLDERGRYFDGQFLTSQDFVDEQRYHVDRLRRALDHLTVSGVCEGLDVAAAGAWKLKLSPGVAIDGAGRQLIALAARDAVDVPKDIPGGVVDVALYYAEVESRTHGGTSDEDGTRGASRFRELPALEFYAQNQAPTHPEAVPLARLRITGDGAITVDNPSPVRRMTGLRLPSSGAQNAPTLRAGFARPQLLALTGDLQVTGKLGVGTPDPEGELDVRGLARITQLSVREQSFKVAGDEASFYPIVFRDLDWSAGECVLEIVRPNAQADLANAGSLMARLRWHAADGQGSDLLDVDVVQTRRYVAGARLLASQRLLVIWLRGNRSYAWRANQRVELADGAAASKTIAGEKLDPRQNIDTAFDRDRYRLGRALDREEVRGGLTVNGDLQYTGKLSHLDTAEFPGATLRITDLLLGHSTRRGTPGRALVDNTTQLVVNYNGDWAQTTIAGAKTQITGDTQLDRTLTVGGGVQGDLTLNTGNLKLTAGGLTVTKLSSFTDQVTISRDNELLRLSRPKSSAGGPRMFLEVLQEDTNPPTTPETYPYIRFHHAYRYYSRLEARSSGFHLRVGDPNNDGYVDLFARGIKASGDLATDGALSVARAATFSNNLRVTREAEHMTLHRAPTETTGGTRMFLELFQEDASTPKIPEVGPSIRFHHNFRFWHRIEARGDGFHLRTGDMASGDYSALFAANLVSNGLHVATGKGERLRMVRGTVDEGGSIAKGSGFTVLKEGNCWKIIFNTPFDDDPSVVATQQYPNDGNTGAGASTLDNSTIVRVDRWAAWVRTGNGSGNQTWRRFHFIAIGP